MNQQKKTSPWVYVAIGCVGILVMGLIGLGTVAYLGYRKVKEIGEEMQNPEIREAKVKAVLGADRLPEGYHPALAMSIPFFMDMAILSGKPPGPGGQMGDMGERSFIYINMLGQAKDQQELREYFEGKRKDSEALRRINVNVDGREVLKQGMIDQDTHQILYMAQRGDVSVRDKRQAGIATTLLVQCPKDARMRMGIWLEPDPGGDELAGTPADEAAIKAFMGHFRPCGS